MDSLNISYAVMPANINEKAIRDKDFIVRAEKIARAKAEKILEQYPDAIILAGDSFAVNNGKVFEKPESIQQAKEMLKEESGGRGMFYAGFCYIDQKDNINFSTTITVNFNMRVLQEIEIENFVKSFPVLTWSGALFPGNVYGASMINKIEGSLSAFIYGFPTELIIEYLNKSGIEVHP